MPLFEDVTSVYVQQEGQSKASPVQMTFQELKRLHQTGLAIADTETTGIQAGENGLTEIAVIRAMTVEEIRSFNVEAEKRGISQDQYIPIPEQADEKDIRLIALQHFILPNRPMIHDPEHGHAMPNASYNSDRQQLFEYEIHPKALQKTDTQLLRKKGYGPLVDLTIHGKRAGALPSFVPLMQSFLLFTGKGTGGPEKGVCYFNAPFDTPFLRELFIDAKAYEEATQNNHLHYPFIVGHGLAPNLQENYHDKTTTPEIRGEILKHIRKQLVDSGVATSGIEEYFAPARWYCALQAYRAAYPNKAGYTLDHLMEMAGIAQGDRGAHSAVEDVVLTARGMLFLLQSGKLEADKLPAMGELPGLVLRRSHGPSASSHATPNGRDVVIQLSAAQTPHAAGVRNWLDTVNRARPADPLVPPLSPTARKLFTEYDATEEAARITISGKDKKPRFLSLQKNLVEASHLLDEERYPWLTCLEAHDRPGTFVDVKADGKTVEDVPWNILRRNVEYIDRQPAEQRAALLKVLRDIEERCPELGGVILREENGLRYFRLYGHVRHHGTVDIPWPKHIPLAEAEKTIFSSLEIAVRLGLVPHAVRGELLHLEEDSEMGENDTEEEEESKTHSPDTVYSSTTLDIIAPEKGPHIHQQIRPELFQLFKASLPVDKRTLNMDHKIHTVKDGHHYTIAVNRIQSGEKAWISLDGPWDAFNAYVASKKPDGSYEPVAEKPTNILTNAGWLLDRLEKIPGTSGIQVSKNYRIRVQQPLGINTEALALMHHIGIPHRVSEKEIRFSAGALMQDAFTWSLAITRALKSKSHISKMNPHSIVPSICKGLLDSSDKSRNQKHLEHVHFHPHLGLQLHYIERGTPREVIRIPRDKMVSRTLPQGRRRVQRVFAMLMYPPQEHASTTDDNTHWDVRMTPFEKTLFMRELEAAGAAVEWKQNEKGEEYFTIAESDLAKRSHPVFGALQNISDRLARISELGNIPEWFFTPEERMTDSLVDLHLLFRNPFSQSAPEVYGKVQQYVQSMQNWEGSGKSLSGRIRDVMGRHGERDSSILRQLDFSLRRNPDASLAILLNQVEHAMPELKALHWQSRDLARHITPSGEPRIGETLALDQAFAEDRVLMAQCIAAAEGNIQHAPPQAEYWKSLRNKAIHAEDVMAKAIHGADRLKEALETGAGRIANDQPQWKKSLIGATIHARLDNLDNSFLDAVHTGEMGLIDEIIAHQEQALRQFHIIADEEKKNEEKRGRTSKVQKRNASSVITPYLKLAALRLAVRFATESNTDEKEYIRLAALDALRRAYTISPEKAQAFLECYTFMADPKHSKEESLLQAEKAQEIVADDKPKGALWLPLLVFGKATATDIVESRHRLLDPRIEKDLEKAFNKLGQAHFHCAASLTAQLEAEKDSLPPADYARIDAQRQDHLQRGSHCYAEAGRKESSAHAFFQRLCREAREGNANFQQRLHGHRELFDLQQKRDDLIRYTPSYKRRILEASVELQDGKERFKEYCWKEKRTEYCDALLEKAQAINAGHPDFNSYREMDHKRNILRAQKRMLQELDDLGKIEYHARRDFDALSMFLHDAAVELDPRLEAVPLKEKEINRPEQFGLTPDMIPDLREGMERLDRLALKNAKGRVYPGKSVTEEEWRQRMLRVPLDLLLELPQSLDRATDETRAASVAHLPPAMHSYLHHAAMAEMGKAQLHDPASPWVSVQDCHHEGSLTPVKMGGEIALHHAYEADSEGYIDHQGWRCGKMADTLLKHMLSAYPLPDSAVKTHSNGSHSRYRMGAPYTVYAAYATALAQKLAGFTHLTDLREEEGVLKLSWSRHAQPEEALQLMSVLHEYGCAPEENRKNQTALQRILNGHSASALELTLPPIPLRHLYPLPGASETHGHDRRFGLFEKKLKSHCTATLNRGV